MPSKRSNSYLSRKSENSVTMSPRWSVIFFFFFNGLVLGSLASRFPLVQELFGISHLQLGHLLLSMSVGAFIFMPVTGYLIHRFGSKEVTFISAMGLVVSCIAISVTPAYGLAFIAFFLMGMSNGIMDVAMNAQAVEVEKLVNKPIMTFFHAMFSVGMVVGALGGSVATAIGWGLLNHLGLVALLAFLFLVVAQRFLLIEEENPGDDHQFVIVPNGIVIVMGIIAFCCMLGEGAMADWSTLYMNEIMNSPAHISVFGLSAFAGCMTLGRLVGDQGRSKYGDRKMLIISAIISLVGIILILSKVNFYVVMAGFAFTGLGLSNIVPIVYSLSGQIEGIPTGSGIAMATTIGYSGFMVGAPTIGYLADLSDLHRALFLLLILFILMFFLIIIFSRRVVEK